MGWLFAVYFSVNLLVLIAVNGAKYADAEGSENQTPIYCKKLETKLDYLIGLVENLSPTSMPTPGKLFVAGGFKLAS